MLVITEDMVEVKYPALGNYLNRLLDNPRTIKLKELLKSPLLVKGVVNFIKVIKIGRAHV